VIGPTIPILMYHEVSPNPRPGFRRYTVTVREFTAQMRWLALCGYRTVDMDTLLRARQGLGSLPRRPVLITFDDGFEGCAQYALPVLRAYHFTAVFYLVPGMMGEASRWMLPELGLELPLMSWDTARMLVAEGFQCGAHTVTHPRLAELDPPQCRAELIQGRTLLERELGRPIVHLAYPFGSYDGSVQAMAREAGYATACSTRPGLSEPGDDLLALHRVTIYGHDSLFDFVSRLQSGTAVRERMSRALNSWTDRLRQGWGSQQ